MDNVLFGLGLLSAIGVIAFLVIAVVRIFKKKPRKNFVVAALICFVASYRENQAGRELQLPLLRSRPFSESRL